MRISEFQKRKVRRLNWIKLVFFLSLVLSFAFLLVKINNMFISAVLAVVLSQALRPLADGIEEKLGFGRFSSTLIVFGGVGALSTSLVLWATPFLSGQFQSLKKEMPYYISKMSSLVSQFENQVQGFLPEDLKLMDKAHELFISEMTGWVRDIPAAAANSLSILFLCSFIAFFIVKDSHAIMKGFLSLVPNHIFETTLSLTHQINKQIGKFIRVRIIEAAIVGVITGIGLQLISFPYALLLGLFAGVMNVIPYLGPVIGFAPALIMALAYGMDFIGILSVSLVYITAQVIDNVLIIPVFVARMMRLHPVTVVVLVTAGAQFMGILGMIISIPVANAIQVSYQAVYQHIVNAESNR